MSRFIISALLLVSAQTFAAPVEFRVQKLATPAGRIEISLFAQPADWARETAAQLIVISPLKSRTATITVDLPPGEYAFFLYQDVNNNGQLERSFVGLPKEPYAFSNNVEIHLSKPSWDAMKFTVTKDGAKQIVDLVQP